MHTINRTLIQIAWAAGLAAIAILIVFQSGPDIFLGLLLLYLVFFYLIYARIRRINSQKQTANTPAQKTETGASVEQISQQKLPEKMPAQEIGPEVTIEQKMGTIEENSTTVGVEVHEFRSGKMSVNQEIGTVKGTLIGAQFGDFGDTNDHEKKVDDPHSQGPSDPD